MFASLFSISSQNCFFESKELRSNTCPSIPMSSNFLDPAYEVAVPNTRKPSFFRVRAIAFPIPLLAPVTSAVFMIHTPCLKMIHSYLER